MVVDICTASPRPGSPVPWWDRLTGAQDPVTRMCERRAEERRALALVGRDAVALDLLDAQYGGSGRSPAWLAAPARERKLRALAEYRTQRAAIDDLAFVPLDGPRALAFEVSWEVSP